LAVSTYKKKQAGVCFFYTNYLVLLRWVRLESYTKINITNGLRGIIFGKKVLAHFVFQLFFSDIWVFHLIDLIANIYIKFGQQKNGRVLLIFVLIDKKLFF
jgi:hypothetical protein